MSTASKFPEVLDVSKVGYKHKAYNYKPDRRTDVGPLVLVLMLHYACARNSARHFKDLENHIGLFRHIQKISAP